MNDRPDQLVIVGLGYTGAAIARDALAAGFAVIGTVRDPASRSAPPEVTVAAFDQAGDAVARATHLLVTAAPGEGGDPALARYGGQIAASAALRWIGYISTTGVYGDRQGGWVNEATPPAPGSDRTRRRAGAEQAWAAFAGRLPVDIFRAAGIYGPGRSVFDDLRGGHARRTVKPGHSFGRIHRDDIALAVLAAMRQARPPGLRVLNLSDDEPAESADVVSEAARLLGVDPPAPVPFAQARAGMSPMALSFWSENRKVDSRRTKEALGIAWRYPTYREGLRAILLEEGADRPA